MADADTYTFQHVNMDDFLFSSVRSSLPLGNETSFDPRTSVQYGFEFEPFTMDPEETPSQISNIRLYTPFFFGTSVNVARGRKRSGDPEPRHLSRSLLSPVDLHDASTRLGGSQGVKKSKTLHDMDDAYDYFNRTIEASPSNLSFNSPSYGSGYTMRRNKRKKEFEDIGPSYNTVQDPATGGLDLGYTYDDEYSAADDPFGFDRRYIHGPIPKTLPAYPPDFPSSTTLFPSSNYAETGSVDGDGKKKKRRRKKKGDEADEPDPPPPVNLGEDDFYISPDLKKLLDTTKQRAQPSVHANAQSQPRAMTPVDQQAKNVAQTAAKTAQTPTAASVAAKKATALPLSNTNQHSRSSSISSTSSTTAPSYASNSGSGGLKAAPKGHNGHTTRDRLKKGLARKSAGHNHAQHQHHVRHQHDDLKSMKPQGGPGDIWNVPEEEERRRIKEFWLSLNEKERSSMIKLEKDAVLKKMKEQQRHTCQCSVCGRRRTAIEEELELLYDAYYDELEKFAEKDEALNLGLKGSVLSVADDLMKNEGKKFLDMMEKLAERRMKKQIEDEVDHDYPESEGEYDEDDEGYEDDSLIPEDEEDDGLTEEQRLEEGRKMFQMFAAKMFEQRVLTAYREKVALEKQQKLIEEEEEKQRSEQHKKEKAQKKREQKKNRKKQLQEEKKNREEEKRREEQRKKEEEEKRRKAEEERKRREAEKREREKERVREKERLAREEERKEKEKKAREAALAPKKAAQANTANPVAPAADLAKRQMSVSQVNKEEPKDETTVEKLTKKRELFDITEFIDPSLTQPEVPEKRKRKRNKKKKANTDPSKPAQSAVPQPAVSPLASAIPNPTIAPGVHQPKDPSPAPTSLKRDEPTKSSDTQARGQQGSYNGIAASGNPLRPSSAASRQPTAPQAQQNQARVPVPSFMPYRGPMMPPPFMPPFFPGAPPPFMSGPPFAAFAPAMQGQHMVPQGGFAQPTTNSAASAASLATPSATAPPFTVTVKSMVMPSSASNPSLDRSEGLPASALRSPRGPSPLASQEASTSNEDDDDMSSFLESLPTTMKAAWEVDRDEETEREEPEPEPAKLNVSRELFKDNQAHGIPMWNYSPGPVEGWEPNFSQRPWSEPANETHAFDRTNLYRPPSAGTSPLKARNAFLHRSRDDPYPAPAQRPGPPQSASNALDMKSRIRVAFEVIRRRLLDLPPSERRPVPFDVWARLMLLSDPTLAIDPHSTISELMGEHERRGLVTCDKGACVAVHDGDVSCPLCVTSPADVMLNPCHHILCSQCFALSSPANCPYCSKTISKATPISSLRHTTNGGRSAQWEEPARSRKTSWSAPGEPNWGSSTATDMWSPPGPVQGSWPGEFGSDPIRIPPPSRSAATSSIWGFANSSDEFASSPPGANYSGAFGSQVPSSGGATPFTSSSSSSLSNIWSSSSGPGAFY